MHVCGMGGKRPCASSTDIREFRLGGVHARIGSVRSLGSSLISYSGQRRLQGCIANQWKMNELSKRSQRPLRFRMHLYAPSYVLNTSASPREI